MATAQRTALHLSRVRGQGPSPCRTLTLPARVLAAYGLTKTVVGYKELEPQFPFPEGQTKLWQSSKQTGASNCTKVGGVDVLGFEFGRTYCNHLQSGSCDIGILGTELWRAITEACSLQLVAVTPVFKTLQLVTARCWVHNVHNPILSAYGSGVWGVQDESPTLGKDPLGHDGQS